MAYLFEWLEYFLLIVSLIMKVEIVLVVYDLEIIAGFYKLRKKLFWFLGEFFQKYQTKKDSETKICCAILGYFNFML